MENSPQPINAAEDRRRFFRISDAVSLSYRPVAEEDIGLRKALFKQEHESDFTIMGSLASVTQEMSGLLHKIQSSEPDIASYLTALDNKIDLLGRAFLSRYYDLADQPVQPVNISASGIAFSVQEKFEPGTFIELQLLLQPSFTGILIYGKVVSCEKGDLTGSNSSYSLSVDFTHINSSDQDILIRHVIKRQSKLLREKREAREADDVEKAV